MNSSHKPERLQPVTEGDFVDYSVSYKKKEIRQLNKRLRKTRNILLFSAVAFMAGGVLFWVMPDPLFRSSSLYYYGFMTVLLLVLAVLSPNKPYRILVSALVLCLAYWGIEILMGNMDNLLIEGTIHKLCIISVLVSGLHTSREAELIKKELHFS